MRKVEICDYQEEWEELFRQEAEEIKRILGEECVAVHHIGSTAVRGLAAKPVIDLLPVVKNIETVDRFNPKFELLGYEGKGENGLKGRRYFQKGGDLRTHHMHIYENGSGEIYRHLAFRDYLKKHPQEAEKYGTLKKELAMKYPTDIERYIEGKESFVKEMEKRALEEF
ncbi:dephospho-CoA kinase/protein folding accessory domain-containing protein [Planococcus massiliensis]|uniref:Dephospho-CoA kinase/protein folding accessory domain-containing protein n=1 Tax=Planococcus massiliensis TaxID=1499687 RepID=A0A098ES42_9BACL|nr:MULTISPECIES: GrpB family protein [Planococcus]MCJ1909562.1 GrpB family protein [Planococcus ruber]CEG24126.1 dephospho-CoA kinase/protein folding accessory domain-containing protein [Planococcus massiliensis]